MRIRAAVLNAMGASHPYAASLLLAIEEIDLAPPGPGEVLIKVAAAGLCHSDLSVINGDRPRPMPMALGHEAAGVVEALGAALVQSSGTVTRSRTRCAGFQAASTAFQTAGAARP